MLLIISILDLVIIHHNSKLLLPKCHVSIRKKNDTINSSAIEGENL